jgi:hypothetical protein
MVTPGVLQRPLSGFNGGVRLKFTGPSGGAPDCPVSRPRRTRCSRETKKGDVAIILRTVLWCTELSGEPTVACANGRPCNLRVMRGSSNGQLVHQTVRCAPDSVRYTNQPKRAKVGYAKFGRRSRTEQSTGPVRWRTGLSGAPFDRRQHWPSKLVFNGS